MRVQTLGPILCQTLARLHKGRVVQTKHKRLELVPSDQVWLVLVLPTIRSPISSLPNRSSWVATRRHWVFPCGPREFARSAFRSWEVMTTILMLTSEHRGRRLDDSAR